MAGNPLSRRIRLARELGRLRAERGYTLAGLAERAGVSKSLVGRLEQPAENLTRKTNLTLARKTVRALDVERGSDLWDVLDACAEDGAEGGWWDRPEYAFMGGPDPMRNRQRAFAMAEYRTELILDYGVALLPGPVQTEAYARYRAQVGTDGQDVDVDAVVAGRLRRQAEIFGVVSEEERYAVILEEQTVRRWPVPPPVMLDQLHHLLDLAKRRDVSVQVLPVDAQVANGIGAAPRSPYTIYSYADRDDPTIVIVDTVTTDLLITDAAEVDGYVQLHERLRGAALSDADSAALIGEVAAKLAASV
ncbi:helix-turn-helix transcriptional regulator [Micromonospora sp. WMMD1102]|uniref:helix-turn-helix transcriptional regulator n=1 Tax=Micromonospora sp. WMMD1102 TaxID=3016105 RepID=UPI0024154970|nr:helix-turn-helix transcriptional regulator [Micromonospora sp. WMMD1102]MDG4792033.1 helix-turn-helix transcriptional regulator [Micromonospora sp. WMMD1102]